MRQVPTGEPVYGILGNGRLSRHLQHYFSILRVPFVVAHRGVDTVEVSDDDLRSMLAKCGVVLLAVRDDALATLARRVAALGRQPIVHFSGARLVPEAYAWHPLMTFAQDFYASETYARLPFVGVRGEPAFAELFPRLRNPNMQIEASDRPLYHALCVLAGNGAQLLVAHARGEFAQRLGLKADLLDPFLRQSLENVLSRGPDAVSGPIVRGDQGTIEANLAALDGSAFAEVYRALAAAHAATSSAAAHAATEVPDDSKQGESDENLRLRPL